MIDATRIHLVGFHRVIGTKHPPHHMPDHRHGDGGCVVGDFPSDGIGDAEQIILGMDAPNQTTSQGFLGIEDAARVTPLKRLADADDAWQEVAGAGFRHDAPSCEDEAKLGVVRGNSDIHGQLHGDANTDGGAIYRSNHGFFAFVDAQGKDATTITLQAAGPIGACVGVERAAATGQVCPRTKRAPGTGDDNGSHVVVGICSIEGVDHLGHHVAGEGIECLRAMQREGQDAVLQVVQKCVVGHARSIPWILSDWFTAGYGARPLVICQPSPSRPLLVTSFMNLSLTILDQSFVDSIRQFAADHWRGDLSEPGGLLAELRAEGMTAAERIWFDALTSAGWSVPTWPVEEGGAGWSRTWQFLFMRELAVAGAPLPVSLATEVVAPALFTSAASAARTDWLNAIRCWRSRWCLGVAEAEDQLTAATRAGSGFVVSGEKTWVAGALVADWMLCRVLLNGQLVWMVVSLGEPGVDVQALPVMGSALTMARVQLTGVRVPAEGCLGPALSRTSTRPVSVAALARSSLLRRDLQRVQADPSVRENASLLHACAELGVALDGLEAMELRALMSADALDPEILRTMLAIRGAETGQKLGELRIRSMGYHAVPFPDGERFSNEGVFGDELAIPAVRRALFDRAWTIYAAHHAESSGKGATSVEALRDELARVILGTDLAEQIDRQ